MQIVRIITEKNHKAALRYIYDKAIPTRYSYHAFENLVFNSAFEDLPEFYIFKNNGKYIGYLLLLSDTMDSVPEPFTFLASHNGDELSHKDHCEVLQFMINATKDKKCHTLERLAEHELALLQKNG